MVNSGAKIVKAGGKCLKLFLGNKDVKNEIAKQVFILLSI